MCLKTGSRKNSIWSGESCKLESGKQKRGVYFKLPPVQEQVYLTLLSGKVMICSLEFLLEGGSLEPFKKKKIL